MGAGFARAVVDHFSGYGVYNLLGKTLTVDEFLLLIEEEAAKLGLDKFEISYADGAEQTPFIYDLNCESTRQAFPDMPQTEIREGIRISLRYFQENQG